MTTQADLLSAIVTILSVVFIFYTGINVGRMRAAHKVAAPATTGHPQFECAYRVQVNTVEQFIMFLPLLWLATAYFRPLPWLPAAFGLIWVIGRVLYLQGYMAAPEKRGTGFSVTILSTAALLILSIWGVVQAWMALGAA